MTALWAFVLEWFAAKTASFWVFAAVCFACFLLGGCAGCTFERVRPGWIFQSVNP